MAKKHHIKAADQAITRAGGISVVARAFGIKTPSVCGWRETGVPANRVLPLEVLSGVSRHDLRPDIYPRDFPVAPALNLAGAAPLPRRRPGRPRGTPGADVA